MPLTKTRLTAEEKKALSAFCQTRGGCEADMLRLMITKVINGLVAPDFGVLCRNPVLTWVCRDIPEALNLADDRLAMNPAS